MLQVRGSISVLRRSWPPHYLTYVQQRLRRVPVCPCARVSCSENPKYHTLNRESTMLSSCQGTGTGCTKHPRYRDTSCLNPGLPHQRSAKPQMPLPRELDYFPRPPYLARRSCYSRGLTRTTPRRPPPSRQSTSDNAAGMDITGGASPGHASGSPTAEGMSHGRP